MTHAEAVPHLVCGYVAVKGRRQVVLATSIRAAVDPERRPHGIAPVSSWRRAILREVVSVDGNLAVEARDRIVAAPLYGADRGIDEDRSADPAGFASLQVDLDPVEHAASGDVAGAKRRLDQVFDEPSGSRRESFLEEKLDGALTRRAWRIALEAAQDDGPRAVRSMLRPVRRPDLVVDANDEAVKVFEAARYCRNLLPVAVEYRPSR